MALGDAQGSNSHLQVADDEILWRRIIPDWLHPLGSGAYRPQSMSFHDRRSGNLSVHRAKLTSREQVLKNRPKDSVAAFSCSLVRSLGLEVRPDPDMNDPSHALIIPSPEGKKAKKIAEECTWEFLNPESIPS